MNNLNLIRNFCIIAHIDHGKSTLADRMLELTQTVEQRKMKEQLLDSMDLERERGITIKAHPVTMDYTAKDGNIYTFNLIDTPGHVDFSYEVSRSLQACEGAILVVDAAQGVEAQTVSNTYLANDNNLTIIPVLNKIELPNANIDVVSQQIEDILAIEATDAIQVSAKTGLGVEDVLEAVVSKFPSPNPSDDDYTRALVFDSKYDAFRGVVVYMRLFSGTLKAGDRITVMSTNQSYEVKEVGVFTPEMTKNNELEEGAVGYVIANIKDASEIQIGDTLTNSKNPSAYPLPGFKEIHPMVFAGIYPVETSDYEKLGASMDKLRLNDASFSFQSESSVALGFGFRCGFLGLLHLEIITQRLEREFDINLITTTPGVVYKLKKINNETEDLQNPSSMPDPSQIKYIEEPWIKATVITPDEYLGSIIKICQDKRGIQKDLSYSGNRAVLVYELPLNEVVFDFYDRLKSMTSGYASFDYEITGYKEGDLVKLGILVNNEPVDALSMIIHKEFAQSQGRLVCEKLKDLIPRHNFMIPIQAAIGGKIIARESIKGFKKDVLTKIHGGGARDRKRKLLEKQKKGKSRAKQFGRVEIPQEAFIGVLKINKEN